jgi:hypothetical protein
LTDKGITESEIVDFKYGSNSAYSQPTQITKVEFAPSDNKSAISKVEKEIEKFNDKNKQGSSKSLKVQKDIKFLNQQNEGVRNQTDTSILFGASSQGSITNVRKKKFSQRHSSSFSEFSETPSPKKKKSL